MFTNNLMPFILTVKTNQKLFKQLRKKCCIQIKLTWKVQYSLIYLQQNIMYKNIVHKIGLSSSFL